MDNNAVSFIRVSTPEIIKWISSVKNRIVFAKPAFFKTETAAILTVLEEREIDVTIYMEEGESAIRCGFGETAALELIARNAKSINLHTVKRIRVGILIVDDRAIVFMPELVFIEEESNDADLFPNGLLCSKEITNDIVNQRLNL